MRAIIFRRILVTIISSLTFAIIASILFMNTSYGFGFYFIAFLAYGTPAIFIIGLPFSLLCDVLLRRINIKDKYLYLITIIFLYTGAGLGGSLVYFFILAEGDTLRYEELFPLTLFGMLAALIYLLNIYIINQILRSLSSNRIDRCN